MMDDNGAAFEGSEISMIEGNNIDQIRLDFSRFVWKTKSILKK